MKKKKKKKHAFRREMESEDNITFEAYLRNFLHLPVLPQFISLPNNCFCFIILSLLHPSNLFSRLQLEKSLGVPVVAQRKRIQLGTMRLHVQSLALLSGLKIRCCPELWCRSQMWLGSGVAVAVVYAGSYNSNSTPSLGTSQPGNFQCLKSKNKQKNK